MNPNTQSQVSAVEVNALAELFAQIIVSVSFGIAILLFLYFLFARFRAFFPFVRKAVKGKATKGDLDAAFQEHRLNNIATHQMFGSRCATLFGRFLIVGFCLLVLYLLANFPGAWGLVVLYVGFGYWRFKKSNHGTSEAYKRLLIDDRMSFVLLHSVLWPWHIFRGRDKSISK